jgi:L-ascorbate metabolism protein UlaG (beta-lactamase superfamily)
LVRITKYVHSCLLVEENSRAVLFDPGDYSYASGMLDVDALPELEAVLITHGHFDHCNVDVLKSIRQRWPEVPIVSNPELVEKLESENIQATTQAPEGIACREAKHQPLPWRTPVPDNWSFTVFDRLTHPGDSLHISQSGPVLALPMQGPWGSMREALDLALQLRPEKIIPIHDWHLRDEAREALYKQAQDFLGQYGIEFLPVKNGRQIAV